MVCFVCFSSLELNSKHVVNGIKSCLLTFGFSSGGVTSLPLLYFFFLHIFLQWQMQFLFQGNASRTFSLSSKGLTHNYTWKGTQEIIRGVAGSQNQTDLCVVCDIRQHETRSLAYGHSGKTRGASYGTPCVCRAPISAALSWLFFTSTSGLQREDPRLPWPVLTQALLRHVHR